MLIGSQLKSCFYTRVFPEDTRRKLNVHKTFRRRPGHLLNVLCTSNLRPVSTGFPLMKLMQISMGFTTFNSTENNRKNKISTQQNQRHYVPTGQ